MGQTNQCCQLPFIDQNRFDLNEVKIHWSQVAKQIVQLRQQNIHTISLKKHQNNFVAKTQSHKKIYKQFINSSHCFFGYVSQNYDDNLTEYQQTHNSSLKENKNPNKQTVLQVKKKENHQNFNFLPSSFTLNDFGILVHRDKACYMGNFKQNSFHGKGFLSVLETDEKFDGVFQYGQKMNGTYQNNQIKYVGSFKNNQISGKGKLQFKNTKDIYEGEISNGKMHGKGRIVYSNGDIYEGQFCHGIYHGQGIYYWSSGQIYKGSYKMGIKHGFGTITINGKSEKICWVNGKAEAKPMNYQEFTSKSKKIIQVSKTIQDLRKQEKQNHELYQDDQDEVTSIVYHHRILKTQAFLK